RPIVGNSGTATRAAGHGILGPLTLGLAGHFSGLPVGGDLALAAAPMAGRIASNLATRAYLTRPGAALVRGALALPGAAARGAGNLAANPLLWSQLSQMRQPSGAVMLPPSYPGASSQVLQGVVQP